MGKCKGARLYGSGFNGNNYWTSEANGGSNHYNVNLNNGNVNSNNDSNNNYVVCRQGDTLTGSYVFGDVDGDAEGVSTFKWYRDDVEIAGATAKTYTLVAADEGKLIKFEVTPVSATGIPTTGTAQQSAPTQAAKPLAGTAPTATSVAIDNTAPTVGDTLTGGYVFGDVDGDAEGVSTFKWYRDDVEIAGATAKTYHLVAADEGKRIKFEVTPVSATGIPTTGTAQQSAPTQAVSPPPSCSDLIAGGQTYTCPLSKAKADAQGISYSDTLSEEGVEYVAHEWNSAAAYCAGLGGGYRLPTRDELLGLYTARGDVGAYGWPTSREYWSSTNDGSPDAYVTIDLKSGILGGFYVNADNDVTCVR